MSLSERIAVLVERFRHRRNKPVPEPPHPAVVVRCPVCKARRTRHAFNAVYCSKTCARKAAHVREILREFAA